jgi:hypothetical protein
MDEAVRREAEQILQDRLRGLENLSYEEATAVPKLSESQVTVSGRPADVATWRKQLSPTECLLGVSVSVRGPMGLFHWRWERGWLFSPGSPAKFVEDPEAEIDGN